MIRFWVGSRLLNSRCYDDRGPLVLCAASMTSNFSIRRVLWIAAPFNFGGPFLFAIADSTLGPIAATGDEVFAQALAHWFWARTAGKKIVRSLIESQ
jgi:hypothetical protein